MKFIVKIIRNSITRALYRQRILAANAVRSETDYLDNAHHSSAPTFQYSALRNSQQEMNEQRQRTYSLGMQLQTKGLLELVESKECQFTHGRGDFSKMDSDHFVHALGFSKVDIEHPTFNLNDIQTTVSQTIDNLSFFRNRSIQSEVASREDRISQHTVSSEDEYVSLQELRNRDLVENQRSKVLRPNL